MTDEDLTDIRIEDAAYLPQVVPWHRGNPLIEALPRPFQSDKELGAALATDFRPSAEERAAGMLDRRLMARGLARLWLPRPVHIEIASNVLEMLRVGYAHMNPLDAARWNNARDEALRRMRDLRALRRPGALALWEAARNCEDPAHALGYAVIDLSGVGKTTTLKRVFATMPKVILHDRHTPTGARIPVRQQLVWLLVTCPQGGSTRALCTAIIDQVDRLLKTDYASLYRPPHFNTDQLIAAIACIVHNHGVGLLVIDEIQFLEAAPGASRAMILQFLILLMNTVQLPIVFVGTPAAERLLEGQLQNARRATSEGFDRIGRLADRGELEELLGALLDRTHLRRMPS